MNKTEVDALLTYMNEEILDWTPHGSVKEIKKWIDGFSMAYGMMRDWCMEQIEEGERINENVDAGKRQRSEEWTDREMTGEEDRDQIVRILQELLQHTRAGAALVTLRRIPPEYPIKGETVEAIFINGSKKSHSIHGDSGIGIIRDVLKMF